MAVGPPVSVQFLTPTPRCCCNVRLYPYQYHHCSTTGGDLIPKGFTTSEVSESSDSLNCCSITTTSAATPPTATTPTTTTTYNTKDNKLFIGQTVWVCKSKGRKQSKTLTNVTHLNNGNTPDTSTIQQQQSQQQRYELFSRATILDLLQNEDVNDGDDDKDTIESDTSTAGCSSCDCVTTFHDINNTDNQNSTHCPHSHETTATTTTTITTTNSSTYSCSKCKSGACRQYHYRRSHHRHRIPDVKVQYPMRSTYHVRSNVLIPIFDTLYLQRYVFRVHGIGGSDNSACSSSRSNSNTTNHHHHPHEEHQCHPAMLSSSSSGGSVGIGGLVLVYPETNLYRRACQIHTLPQDHFIELGCATGINCYRIDNTTTTATTISGSFWGSINLFRVSKVHNKSTIIFIIILPICTL
jgi:hypothetical protein